METCPTYPARTISIAHDAVFAESYGDRAQERDRVSRDYGIQRVPQAAPTSSDGASSSDAMPSRSA